MNVRLYLLKISLLDIEPEIWRRFVVPADISLDRLHDVIQIVMGWQDSHLHEFTIGKKRYTEYPESKEEGLVSGRYRLVDLIKQKGRQFEYQYDFGDDWKHLLVLEDNRYFEPGILSPITCLEGARACPPEDVGGTSGYDDLCRILKDPADEEYEEMRQWAGEDYDPERFDTGPINAELLKYFRWSRDRYLNWL